MKKIAFILALVALLCLVSCSGKKESTGTAASAPATTAAAPAEKITLTVWGSQEDQALLKTMCNAYAAANPDKTYKFLYGVQSESDAADKVLNDPESGPDVFAFASDQINKLIQAGALARVGGAILDDIKGIGPKRRKALLLHFKDVDNIKKATLEELTEVEGMDAKAAYAVYEFFN